MGRADALRRYPALSFLVVAAVLALLLPSALHVPLTGPSSSPEVAPIAGRSSQAGAVSELAYASSDGLGSGLGASANQGGAGGGRPTGLGQLRPKHANVKACVGPADNRRQTEDPLSPACVPFFDGDNSGATARGVTRDEVTVVIIGDPSSTTVTWVDLNQPVTDAENAARDIQTAQVRTAKGYAKFFNDRYQTYGRTVHFWMHYGGAPSRSTQQLLAMLDDVVAMHNPFAVVPILTFGSELLARDAAQRGLFVASFAGLPRAAYLANAPRIVSFRPDFEDEAALFASYLCTKLAPAPVKNGEAKDNGHTRVFGTLTNTNSSSPEYAELRDRIESALAGSCNPPLVNEDVSYSDTTSQGSQNTLAMTRLEEAGVTTLIPLSGDAIIFTNSAWHPEIVIAGSFGIQQPDSNDFARLAGQAAWQHAFGISFDYRRGPLNEQPFYSAFKSSYPDAKDPAASTENPAIYDALAMLMYGIQAAGPHLTHKTIDAGLHAIPPHPSSNPFTPATYFTPHGYSYEKDAMEIWWDPSAHDDPATSKPGCYRLPYDGRRFRVGEWPNGEDEIFAVAGGGQPCQASFGP